MVGCCHTPTGVLQAVREAVDIPVLANGNVQTLADVHACMEYTGAVGVMSAESLLEDPALFRPSRMDPGGAKNPTEGCDLLLEYLDLAETYPTPFRMIRGHAFSLLGMPTPRTSCTFNIRRAARYMVRLLFTTIGMLLLGPTRPFSFVFGLQMSLYLP